MNKKLLYVECYRDASIFKLNFTIVDGIIQTYLFAYVML